MHRPDKTTWRPYSFWFLPRDVVRIEDFRGQTVKARLLYRADAFAPSKVQGSRWVLENVETDELFYGFSTDMSKPVNRSTEVRRAQ